MATSIPGLPPPTKTGRLRNILARCHDDTELFNLAILGGSPFWHRQREASYLAAHHHTTVLPWGNALGKSWWLARECLAFLCTRPGAMVVTTAPSHDQLDGVLWKNLRQAIAQSRYPLGIKCTRKPLRASLGEGWDIVGIATSSTERFSGRHAAELLAVKDEASGIESAIDDGIDSLIPSRVIEIGNPLRYDGRFRENWDEAEKQKRENTVPPEERTVALRVPSTDSPHIHLDTSPLGMACGSWLRRMERKYGKASLWWRTHIDARFPEAAYAGLIPPDWLDAGTMPGMVGLRMNHAGGPTTLAADLGEGTGRDSTTILVRDWLGILEVTDSSAMGLDEAAAEMARLASKWHVKEDRMSYDAMGIGRAMRAKLERHGITRALAYKGSSSGGRDFSNLRGACAWAVRQRLDPTGIVEASAMQGRQFLPFIIVAAQWWPQMREELLAIRYDLRGEKTRLETKEELCDTLGRSPDRGDALIQSFAHEALQRIAA